jgi:peptidoglycan hydrolase CwlO-like protein
MPTKLTNEILTAAIAGFEEQKRRIDSQISELQAMLAGAPAEASATPEKRTRRKMSAAGRKAIAEAQRKRWAASKKAAEPSTPSAAPKAKRKLSAAGRKAISLATKKRWALKRAEAAKES